MSTISKAAFRRFFPVGRKLRAEYLQPSVLTGKPKPSVTGTVVAVTSAAIKYMRDSDREIIYIDTRKDLSRIEMKDGALFVAWDTPDFMVKYTFPKEES